MTKSTHEETTPATEQPAAAADAPAVQQPAAATEQPAAAADAPAADAPAVQQPAATADAPDADVPSTEQPAAAADAPAAAAVAAPEAEQPAAAAHAPAEQPKQSIICIDRVLKLPLVEAAITKSTGIYSRVKRSNLFLDLSLSTATRASKLAIHFAVPVTYPMLVILRQPIRVIDWSLCRSLDVVESMVPIITVPPQQVYDMAKERVDHVKTFGSDKARSLADLSWQKANEVLKTRYGTLAFQSFDLSAETAEKFFDLLLPPVESEKLEDTKEQDPDDRVGIAVYTVGRLSNKMVRRVYSRISSEVKQLEKEKDKFPLYFRSLVVLLSLTTYVNSCLDKKPQDEDNTATTQTQDGTS